MTSTEFFKRVTKPPPYYYYAGELYHCFYFTKKALLQDMGEFFESDVEPREQFVVKDDYYNPSVSHKNKYIHLERI